MRLKVLQWYNNIYYFMFIYKSEIKRIIYKKYFLKYHSINATNPLMIFFYYFSTYISVT